MLGFVATDVHVQLFESLPIIEGDDLVALPESRERRVHCLSRTLSFEQSERHSHGVDSRSLGFRRVYRNSVSHLLQSLDRKHGSFSAFEDVNQERNVGNKAWNLLQFRFRLRRFNKDRVNAEFGKCPASLDCVVKTMHASRIGARDDAKVRIGATGERSF